MDRLEALAVLIGVDLPVRQPLGQDLLGIWPLLLIAPPGRRNRATASTATSAQKLSMPSVISNQAHPLIE